MDRGPMALFWAIVAVGLGPAMWLGVQLGSIDVAPTRFPPASSEHRADSGQVLGGSGGGVDATGRTRVIKTTPRADVAPLSGSSATSPAADATTDPEPDASSATPSRSAEPSASPSTAPTESTVEPTGTPGGEGGGSGSPTVSPSASPSEDGFTDPTDPAGPRWRVVR